jgi:hypothetical protein
MVNKFKAERKELNVPKRDYPDGIPQAYYLKVTSSRSGEDHAYLVNFEGRLYVQHDEIYCFPDGGAGKLLGRIQHVLWGRFSQSRILEFKPNSLQSGETRKVEGVYEPYKTDGEAIADAVKAIEQKGYRAVPIDLLTFLDTVR